MTEKEFLSASETDTENIAKHFVKKQTTPSLVLLEGQVGAGKSVFTRAAIRLLCEDPELNVPSPTFTLVQSYDSPEGQIWHFDLYRLQVPEEIYELGWEDAVMAGFVFIEWPERLGHLRPKDAQTVLFDIKDTNTRMISFK